MLIEAHALRTLKKTKKNARKSLITANSRPNLFPAFAITAFLAKHKTIA